MFIRYSLLQAYCSAVTTLALAFLILAGCGAAKAVTSRPTLVPSPCRYATQDVGVEGEDYYCAELTVAENHRDADNPGTVSLHVIRFTSGDPNATPTLFLNGGPGQTFDAILPFLTPEVRAAFTAVGDFVAFDQRGAKHARPALLCEEAGNAATPTALAAAYDACRERYIEAGVDLFAWDTESIADDVSDLVAALGADHVNLLGVSYGTRVALEVMRRHPGIVRYAVLDSLATPDYYTRPNAPQAFADTINYLFTACEADAACAVAFPGLRDGFPELVAKLDAQPLTLPGCNLDLDGETAML